MTATGTTGPVTWISVDGTTHAETLLFDIGWRRGPNCSACEAGRGPAGAHHRPVRRAIRVNGTEVFGGPPVTVTTSSSFSFTASRSVERGRRHVCGRFRCRRRSCSPVRHRDGVHAAHQGGRVRRRRAGRVWYADRRGRTSCQAHVPRIRTQPADGAQQHRAGVRRRAWGLSSPRIGERRSCELLSGELDEPQANDAYDCLCGASGRSSPCDCSFPATYRSPRLGRTDVRRRRADGQKRGGRLPVTELPSDCLVAPVREPNAPTGRAHRRSPTSSPRPPARYSSTAPQRRSVPRWWRRRIACGRVLPARRSTLRGRQLTAASV